MSRTEIHEAMIAAALEAFDRADREAFSAPECDIRAAFIKHARDRLGQVAQAIEVEIDQARLGDQ